MTRKEKRARAELKVSKLVEKLAKEYMSDVYSDLTSDEVVDKMIRYADSLIQENPQEGTLVKRACAKFVETLERKEKE